MRESEVLSAVRLVFGQADGFVVWRNQTGFYQIENRSIRYGVGTGGSDLLGIAPGGLFLAVECKGQGKLTGEQRRFLQLVYDSGGAACETRSAQQAEEQIHGIRAGNRKHF